MFDQKLLFFAIIALGLKYASTQSASSNWTWISGSNIIPGQGIYGTRGISSPSNIPGGRNDAVSWKDSNNNFWFFGGYVSLSFSGQGCTNDLWKFDGVNWTWISGSNLTNQIGNYGTKGIASLSNVPGARCGAVSWIDSNNNLWLFGGQGYDSGTFNDLWKFDGVNWTWISGSNLTNQRGTYGTKGIANSLNIPGARYDAASWIDSNNNLWLFGGYFSWISTGYLNDLWKFDGINWTWISGSNTADQRGTYGTKGIASSSNIPGARYGVISWIDSSNNLWIFGGYGFPAGGAGGYLNDLWKFNGMNWTWVSGSNLIDRRGTYGTKGIANSLNIPGARYDAVSWIDSNNNLWLFGGNGYSLTANYPGQLNDLWKFDGINWTWISGSNSSYIYGTYGTKGIASSSNIPGARYGAVSWIDSNNTLWLFGGEGYLSDSVGPLNDLWKFNGINWTWVSGSNSAYIYGTYGTQGIANSSNIPGARYGAASWTDLSNNLWLFGGVLADGFNSVYFNDLWKFNGMNWIWISGSNSTNQIGNYGTKGIASSTNIPGGRRGALSWIDSNNNLWLFGGNGINSFFSSFFTTGYFNDLWKFDGTYWIWISGSNSAGQRGTYGTQGIARSSNIPGARRYAVSWIDSGNNFWIFGGYGEDAATDTESGQLNDLWKYNGTFWTWISGSYLTNQNGDYGTKGIANLFNVPGARSGAVSWIDSYNNLWLFGGNGYDATSTSEGDLNDLWKFNGMNWIWISGSDSVGESGTYGTKGIANSTNIPGGRNGAVTWRDSNDNLWLFGGYGSLSFSNGYLNDLWKFDGTYWTWISGSNLTNQNGNYGTKGIASYTNIPGARRDAVSWIDSNNTFWIFGGICSCSFFNFEGVLNDLWKFDGTPFIVSTTSMLTTSPFTSSPVTSAMLTTSPITSSELTTSPITSAEVTSSILTTAPFTTSALTSAEITTSPATSGEITTSPITSSIPTTSILSTQALTTSQTPTGSSLNTDSSKRNTQIGIILASISVVIIVAVAVLVIVLKRRSLKKKNAELEMQDQPSVYKPLPNVSYNLLNANSTSSLDETDYTSIVIKEKTNIANKEDQRFIIDYNEITILKKVGGGYFGDVYKAEWRDAFVAVKQLKEGVLSETALEEFEAEAKLMQSLRIHPNVVLFYGLCKSPLCIITEFVAKGSLSSILESKDKMDKSVQLKIIIGIARGMNHLSFEKIIHKDLAARNVLITELFEAKVGDFGMSRTLSSNSNQAKLYEQSEVGPLKWMAPESIMKSQYSTKSDVYSFGITIIEILTCERLFSRFNNSQFIEELLSDKIHPAEELSPENYSEQIIDLVRTCTSKNPDVRPSFGHIMKVLNSNFSL